MGGQIGTWDGLGAALAEKAGGSLALVGPVMSALTFVSLAGSSRSCRLAGSSGGLCSAAPVALTIKEMPGSSQQRLAMCGARCLLAV